MKHITFFQTPTACFRNVGDDVPYKQTCFAAEPYCTIAKPQLPFLRSVEDDAPYKQTFFPGATILHICKPQLPGQALCPPGCRQTIFLFLTGLRLGKNTCLSRRPRRREPKSGADAMSASIRQEGPSMGSVLLASQTRAQRSGSRLKRGDKVATLNRPGQASRSVIIYNLRFPHTMSSLTSSAYSAGSSMDAPERSRDWKYRSLAYFFAFSLSAP